MRVHSLPAVALAFLTVFSAMPVSASTPELPPTTVPEAPQLAAGAPDGEVDGTSNAFGADGSGDWHAYNVPDYQGGILVLSGAAEPTGGVCWRPGPDPEIFFFKNTLGVARGVWDDTADPPQVAWTDVSREIYPEGHSVFLDPFLHTDEQTCRTFAGHMMLPSPCGDFAFRDETDPDLLPTPDQWVPIPAPCQLTMQDHESLGTGPYSKDVDVPADALYPRIAYYCAQYIGTLVGPGLGPNSCAMSYDGGLTWPAVTMSSDQTRQVWQCAGLHGMVKVSPEGYAVKPHRRCLTHAGLEITKNNGLTWSAIDVPGMGQAAHFDPSIHFSSGPQGAVPSGPGAGNSVLYFGLANPTSADVAVSRDFGLSWDNLDADATPKKISVSSFYTGPAGEKITRTEFANVVAGDWDRAAISFLGSTDTNPATDHSTCPGSADFVWNMYVGRTFDAGRTWAVERVTDHPVQIGSIFAGGFSTGDSSCRNLLDFNDLDVDSDGRVYVSFADGCPEASCWKNGGTANKQPTNSRSDGGVVVRQSAGRGLFAANDLTALLVDAGGPYQGVAGAATPIAASVLNAAGPVTYAWSIVSGGTGAFDDAAAAATGFIPDAAGSYVLQVSVDDGTQVATDTTSFAASSSDLTLAIETIGGQQVVAGDAGAVSPVGGRLDVAGTAGHGSPNEAPVAGFTAVVGGLDVQFTDTSTDDGTIAAWAWDFGDGATSTVQDPTHTYATAGTYTVQLTVTDDGGKTDAASDQVDVTSPEPGWSFFWTGDALAPAAGDAVCTSVPRYATTTALPSDDTSGLHAGMNVLATGCPIRFETTLAEAVDLSEGLEIHTWIDCDVPSTSAPAFSAAGFNVYIDGQVQGEIAYFFGHDVGVPGQLEFGGNVQALCDGSPREVQMLHPLGEATGEVAPGSQLTVEALLFYDNPPDEGVAVHARWLVGSEQYPSGAHAGNRIGGDHGMLQPGWLFPDDQVVAGAPLGPQRAGGYRYGMRDEAPVAAQATKLYTPLTNGLNTYAFYFDHAVEDAVTLPAYLHFVFYWGCDQANWAGLTGGWDARLQVDGVEVAGSRQSVVVGQDCLPERGVRRAQVALPTGGAQVAEGQVLAVGLIPFWDGVNGNDNVPSLYVMVDGQDFPTALHVRKQPSGTGGEAGLAAQPTLLKRRVGDPGLDGHVSVFLDGVFQDVTPVVAGEWTYSLNVAGLAGEHEVAAFYREDGVDSPTAAAAFTLQAAGADLARITDPADGATVAPGSHAIAGDVTRSGGTAPPTVTVGPDQAGASGATLTFTATTTGSDLACSWTFASPAGSATFTTDTTSCTTVQLTSPDAGSVTVRLTATNAGGSASDTAVATWSSTPPPLQVDIVEASRSGDAGSGLAFTAVLTGGSGAPACTWSIEPAGPEASATSCAGATFTSATPGAFTVTLAATAGSETADDTAEATWTAVGAHGITIASPAAGATVAQPFSLTGGATGTSDGTWSPLAATSSPLMPSVGDLDPVTRSQAGLFWQPWMDGLEDYLGQSDGFIGLVPSTWTGEARVDAYYAGPVPVHLRFLDVPLPNGLELGLHGGTAPRALRQELPADFEQRRGLVAAADTRHTYEGLPVEDAPWNTGIGPGSPTAQTIPGDGSYACTANYVWKDQDGKLYLGLAGHCVLPASADAALNSGGTFDTSGVTVDVCIADCLTGGASQGVEDFVLGFGNYVRLGKVAYARQSFGTGGNGPLASGTVGNDFALVEIPPEHHHHIDASMPVWNGPTALDPMAPGTQGGRISQIHGNSVGYGEAFAGKSRLGVSLERQGAPGQQLGNQVWGNGDGPGGQNGYWMALMPGEMGDSGSAVNILDPGQVPGQDAGDGAGVLTHGIGPWNILTRLSKAVGMAASEGLCIAMVPGDADPVTFPAPAATEACGGGDEGPAYDVQTSPDGTAWTSVDAFDPATGAWSATIQGLPAGAATLRVRLLLDGNVVASAQRSLVLQVPAGCGGTSNTLVDDDADDDGIGVAAGEVLCLGARRVGDNVELLALVEDKADVPSSGTVPTDFYYDFWFVPSWTGASSGIWAYATWDGTTLGSVTWEDQDDPLSLVPLTTPLNTATAEMRWDDTNPNLLILEFPLSNFETAPGPGDGFTGIAVGPNTFNEADGSVYLDCSPGTAATDCADRDGGFTLAAGGSAPRLPPVPGTRAFGPRPGSSGERVEVYVDGTFVGEDAVATAAGGSDAWSVTADLASGTRTVTAEWYDGTALLDAAQATYTVTGPLNSPPTADAGPDATVAEGTSHQLAGTGTDPDAGDTLTYAWSKVSGPAVTFTPDAGVEDPLVNLPSLDADATLVLRLTVSDGTDEDTAEVVLAIEDQIVDAPTQVTDLQVTGQTDTSISLAWSPASDNVGVHHYDLVRDGVVVASPTGTSATDTGLSPDLAYSYVVRAVDAAGNAGPASTAVQATITIDTTETWYAHQTACRAGWRMDKTDSAGDFESPCFQTEASAGEPGEQVGSPLGPMAVYGNSVPTYGARAGDDVAGSVFIEYDESVAGHNTVTVTLDADGTEVFRAAVARDHAPGAGTGGVTFPPYIEFDFTGTLAAGYAQGADLVWTVYHDGAARAGLGYEGDHATFLRIESTATPDFVPPTKVLGLEASEVGATSVRLAWTAVTDASGVTYHVERALGAGAFQDAGTSAAPAFVDDGLSPETAYRYRVRAVDSVGNAGAPSDVLQTLTLPPDPRAFVEILTPASGATLDGPATVTGVAGRTASGADGNGDGFVVIAVPDSGINMYHRDFAGASYPRNLDADPDNDVDFRAHPSTYLAGFPSSVPALDLTIDGNFNKNADVAAGRFGPATLNKLLWIPGTKIIGAIDMSNTAAVNSAGDVVPIYDEDGHGTASASVAAGNVYGSCKECLIVFIEGLGGDTWAASQPWIDIVSKSGGSPANVGIVDPDGVFGLETATREAAQRGQSLLYAAGNGCLAFACVEQTYTPNGMGPDWTLAIGAAVEYNDGSTRSVLQSGKPVDLSSYSLRSSGAPYKIDAACPNSATGRCEHSGTSSATPITAGHLGRVLLEARNLLGDEGRTGPQRVGGPGAAGFGAVAQGNSYADSPYLVDGVLTRAELWHIAFHSASAMADGPSVGPHYLVSNGGTGVGMGASPADYAYAGYGIADDAMQARALRVLRGEETPQPRAEADTFFAVDAAVRDALWGDWDDDLDTIPSQFAPPPVVPGLEDLGLSARSAVDDVDGLFDAFGSWYGEHGEAPAWPQVASSAHAPACDGGAGASVTLRLGTATGPVLGTAPLPTADGECTSPWSIEVDFGALGTQETTLVAVYDDGAGGLDRDSVGVHLVLDPGTEVAHAKVGSFAVPQGPVDDMAFEQRPEAARERSPSSHLVRFTVPEGTRRLELELEWPEPTAAGVPVPVNDLDLYVFDGAGNDVGGTAAVSEAMPERFTLDLPAPGVYEAWISPYIVTGAGGQPSLPYVLEVTLSAPDFPDADGDGDGIDDAFDNCALANPDQHDGNGNALGDVCEFITGAIVPRNAFRSEAYTVVEADAANQFVFDVTMSTGFRDWRMQVLAPDGTELLSVGSLPGADVTRPANDGDETLTATIPAAPLLSGTTAAQRLVTIVFQTELLGEVQTVWYSEGEEDVTLPDAAGPQEPDQGLPGTLVRLEARRMNVLGPGDATVGGQEAPAVPPGP